VTSTVTQLTARVIESRSQTMAAGAIAVVLLIVLLIQYQMLPMLGGASALRRSRVYLVAIGPLCVAFVVVVITRLADALNST
jgi:hypothetical protein